MLTICLKTINGQYLGVSDSSLNYKVQANLEGVGQWETYQVFNSAHKLVHSLSSGNKISLRTNFGRFLSAENGGGGNLSADRLNNFEWENFTVEKKLELD